MHQKSYVKKVVVDNIVYMKSFYIHGLILWSENII